MHKLKTCLANFRFRNSGTCNNSSYYVAWFVLDSNADSTPNIRCFKAAEMDEFIDYTIKTPVNFLGNKNYLPCDEDEVLQFGLEIMSQSEYTHLLKGIILRKTPLIVPKDIYSYMDAILVDYHGEDQHTYSLNFSVIGRIDYKIL